MRWPRVRITTGTLLSLVAVLAGNCGALRFLVAQNRNSLRGESIANLLVGLLPVINISLILGFIFACKWISSLRRRGDAIRDSASPLTLTYFCFHFLLVGFLFRH